MNLEPYIAVSGLPGLFRMGATRNNGLIVEDIDTDKTKFCSVRNHQFTPLSTVSIYTLEDTVELKTIFKTMLDQLPTLPLPKNKDNKEVFFEYFDQILPDYDEDKVYINDIKKVVKWFNFLHTRDLLTASDEEE